MSIGVGIARAFMVLGVIPVIVAAGHSTRRRAEDLR